MLLKDFSEKMGTKTLLNSSSSPPIPYKRYSNKCEEQKPLQQQNSYQQQQREQHTGNSINTTCLLVKQHTNTMFTKLRNYFTKFRTSSTASATQQHLTQQQQPKQQQRKSHHHQHYRHEKLTECNSIPIVQSTSNILNIVGVVVTLVFLASINGAISSPVFVDNPSLAQFQSGRNIRHLPCIVRKSGRSGVCMFAIDCIKQNGTHLGTCIDRFYFGSCCDIKEEELSEIADNSIDQNTISHHFTPESSTVATSVLFKLTTLTPLHQYGNINITNDSSSDIISTLAQQDVTQMLNSVTQDFASSTLSGTLKPSTLISNTNTAKPTTTTTAATTTTTTTTTSTKPSQQTTHKHSHFVIRTTAKPNKYTTRPKPIHTTSTKKKTTSSSTTQKPSTSAATTTTTKPILLTTAEQIQQNNELHAEATTQPTKLFTYQIVETTANTPTEHTNIFDFVTTEKIQHETTMSPTSTTSSSPITTIATKLKETSTTTTEATTTTHKTTTITQKPKPQTTRKATTTKKPTSNKRTTVKPTKRPITTTISNTTTTTPTDLKTHANNTTEMQSFPTTTTSQASTTIRNKTTLAPRPRPKPTASIIKIPKPTTTTTIATTTTTTTSTSTTTSNLGTTSETDKIAFTTASSTTKKPMRQTTQSSVTTTTTTTTTGTTPKTTETTTTKPILTSTTHKPGLVTWTNINGEPADPNQSIISEWIPVTSMSPPSTHNKVEETSEEIDTFEKIDVSVSSSVSAVVNNETVMISSPHKPVVMLKPANNTNTLSATNIEDPKTTTTLKPLTSSTSAATEQIETTTTTTTFKPSLQFTTEGFILSSTTTPSSSSTEEMTTEDLNLNSTTISSTTGLEGVDYRQICGRRMFPEPRVVGGSNAAFGRWPWQISLRQWRTSTYLHKCGAALLNENWAITAAHCVDNVPPSDLLLRLGEYDLAEEEEPYGYQERRVQIVASHPQFDPRTFEYDLALLRFYEPVVFQPNIIPVCVPENDEDFIGQTAFVTGWGRLYEDGPLPSVLQEVAVPVINNTICESMYRAAGYIEHIPHIFICAGWKKGGYDSCEGDSGGPMVLQRESDKRFQLGGVISWGIGCAEANQPGVYTRISEFRDWINQILQF